MDPRNNNPKVDELKSRLTADAAQYKRLEADYLKLAKLKFPADNYHEALGRFLKGRKKFFDNVARDLTYTDKLVADYLEATKDLEAAQLANSNSTDKLNAIKKKSEAFARLSKSWLEHQEDYIKKIANGGLDDKDLAAISLVIEQAAKASGASNTKAKEQVQDFLEKIQEIQKKEDLGDRIKESKEVYQDFFKAKDEAQLLISKESEEINKYVSDLNLQIKQAEASGEKFKVSMLKLKRDGLDRTVGGALKEGSKSEALDVLSGGRSKALGNFVTEEGKVSKAAVYKELLSRAGDAGKVGFEAFKASQQYGVHGGVMENINTYQDQQARYNAIGLRTGHSEEEVAAAFASTAKNIRVGTQNLKERRETLLDITNQTLQLSNATGLSVDQVQTLAKSYRDNVGLNWKESSKAALDVSGTLDTINKEVSEKFQITSEEAFELWNNLANSVNTAGVDMKRLQGATEQTQLSLRKMGEDIPLPKIKEMSDKIMEIRTGKIAGAGTGFGSLLALGGGNLPRVKSESLEALGGSRGIHQLSSMDTEDLGSYVEGKLSGTSHQGFGQKLKENIGLDADYGLAFKALVDPGNAPYWVGQIKGGDEKFFQMVTDMGSWGGAKEFFGFDPETYAHQIFQNLKKRVGGQQAEMMMHAVGMEGKDIAIRRKMPGISGTLGGAAGAEGGEAGTKQRAEEASSTTGTLKNLSDPITAFGKAVKSFTSSVYVFAGTTALKGAFDIFGGGGPGNMLVRKLFGGGAGGAANVASKAASATGNALGGAAEEGIAQAATEGVAKRAFKSIGARWARTGVQAAEGAATPGRFARMAKFVGLRGGAPLAEGATKVAAEGATKVAAEGATKVAAEGASQTAVQGAGFLSKAAPVLAPVATTLAGLAIAKGLFLDAPEHDDEKQYLSDTQGAWGTTKFLGKSILSGFGIDTWDETLSKPSQAANIGSSSAGTKDGSGNTIIESTQDPQSGGVILRIPAKQLSESVLRDINNTNVQVGN
jgi:hypothetical protein